MMVLAVLPMMASVALVMPVLVAEAVAQAFVNKKSGKTFKLKSADTEFCVCAQLGRILGWMYSLTCSLFHRKQKVSPALIL